MPQSAAQILPNNEAVLFHLAQMLCEHLLRCLRQHPAQLTQADWSMLKLGQNPRLPLTLDEIDRELRRAFFGNFCVWANRNFFLPFLLGAGGIRIASVHLSRRMPASIHRRITTSLS
jgi:hypothetical protein